jgi:hypothetical protein
VSRVCLSRPCSVWRTIVSPCRATTSGEGLIHNRSRGRATDPRNATAISNEAIHAKLLLRSTIASQVTEMNASKIETFVEALLKLDSSGLKQMLSLCKGDALNLDDVGEQICHGAGVSLPGPFVGSVKVLLPLALACEYWVSKNIHPQIKLQPISRFSYYIYC